MKNIIKNGIINIISKIKTLPLWGKIIALLIMVGIVWFGYTKMKSQQASTPTYQTTQAEKGTLIVSVSATGQVSSANNASVTTKSSGVVKRVYVKNGDVVKAGQKLLEIDLDQNAKQQYQQALASYQSAKNSLESAKTNLYSLQSKLFAANQKFIDGAVASGIPTSDTVYIQQQADWLASEATYKNQQNVITQAQTALNSASLSLQESSPIIYAPISGKVNALSLQVGTVLSSATNSSGDTTSQRIASVVTDAEPLIKVELSEIDVTKVKIGNKVTVTLDALGDKTFTGKIISVDSIGSVSSGVTTYPAVIQLDTRVDDMLPNMSAQANIITEVVNDVILVPSTAVQTQNGTSTVRIMKDGKVQETTVETGTFSSTQTEIKSGIAEGDTVITGSSSIGTTGTGSSTGKTTQTSSPFSAFGSGGGGNFVRIAR